MGYACYGPIHGTQGSFELYWIAVSPDEQRRGLGAQVYARAEAAMRKAGAKHIYADTSSSDRYAGTRGFYQRMGFHEEARLADFYGPGDGKIVYVKALAAEPQSQRHPGESQDPGAEGSERNRDGSAGMRTASRGGLNNGRPERVGVSLR